MASLADAFAEAHLETEPLERDAEEITQHLRVLAEQWEEILSVTANIGADTAAATREITRSAEQWQQQLDDLIVTITADTSEASAELSAFDSFVQEIADSTVTVNAEADTATATADLEAATLDWESIVAAPLVTTVDMDTGGATAQLAEAFAGWAETVDTLTVTPGFDGGQATADLQASVASWEALGRFDVDVGIDTAAADAKIATTSAAWHQLLEVDPSVNPVRLEAEIRRTAARLRGAVAEFNDILDLTATVDVDTAEASARLTAFAAQWEDDVDANVTVTVDTVRATADLLEFANDVAFVDGQTASVRADADITGATAQLEQLLVLADLLDGRVVNVAVDIDAGGVADDAARIDTTIEALTNQSGNIDLTLNSAGLFADLEAVAALLDSICAGCTVEIDVDLGSSLSDLAALKSAVDAACRDQTITVDVDQRGTANPIDDLTERVTRLGDETRINLDVTTDTASAFPDVAATAATWKATLDDAAHATAAFDVPESVFRDVLGLEALLGSVPDDVRTTFSGDTADVVAQIARLRILVEDLNQKSIDVSAAVTANQASITAAAATIDGGIPDDLTTTVGINLGDLRARLTAATAEFAAEHEIWTELARIQAHFGIDSAEATAEMEAWHARSERLASIKADIEVQIADAIAKLTAVETLVDNVDGRDIDINMDVNSDDMQRLLASLSAAEEELGTLTDAAQGFSTVLGDLQRQSRDVEFHARVTGVPEALAAFDGLEVARKRATQYPNDVLDIPAPAIPVTPDVAPDVDVPSLTAAERVAASIRQQQLDVFERQFARGRGGGSNTNKILNALGGERTREGLLDLARQLRRLGMKDAAAEAKSFADRLEDIDRGIEGKTLNSVQRLGERLRAFRRDLNQSFSDARANNSDRFNESFAPIIDGIRTAAANMDLSGVRSRVGTQSVAPQLSKFADTIESNMDTVGMLEFSTDEANVKLDAFSALAHELVGNIRSNVGVNTEEAAAKVRAAVPELRSLLKDLEGTLTVDDGEANIQLREFVESTRRALQFSPDVDAAAFKADLAEMKRTAESTLDFLANVELGDGDMRRDLDLLVDEARFKLGEITANPELNDREITVQLSELATRMRQKLSGIPAGVDFDGADALFEADALVTDLEAKFRKITIPVDMRGAGAEADAFRISRIIAKLLPDRVVDVDMDGGAAVVEAGVVSRIFKRLLGKITTTVDVDAGGATAKVSLLAIGLNKILKSITIDGGGLSSSLIRSFRSSFDGIRALGRDFVRGFSAILAPIGRVASTLFSPFSRAASAAFSGISRGFGAVFGGVRRAATPLVNVASNVFGAVSNAATSAFSTIGTALSGLGSFASKTFAAIGQRASGVFSTLSDIAGPIGKAVVMVLLVGAAVGGLGGAIAGVVPLLLGLVGLTGGFLTLAAGIGVAAGAAGVLGVALNKDLLAKVTDGLGALKSVVASITRPVGEALINNFLDPFLGSLAVLVERAAPLAEAFINPIATASLGWLNTFSTLLGTLDASQFISGLSTGIGDLITTFASYLEPFLAAMNRLNGPAFAGFQGLVKTILDLGLAFEPVMKQIFDLLTNTQAPLTNFGVQAASIFERLFTGLNKIISSEMWQTFIGFLGDSFSLLERFLKGFVEGFAGAEDSVGGFTQILGSIKIVLALLAGSAPLLGAAFNAAAKVMALGFKQVLTVVKILFQVVQSLGTVVLVVIQQIVNGLGTVFGGIIDKVTGAIATVLELLPDDLVPDGWITGLRDAQHVVQDFRDDINSNIGDTITAMDQKFADIDQRMDGLFTSIDTGNLSADLNEFSGGLTDFSDTVNSTSNEVGLFSTTLDASGDTAVQVAKQFKNTTALLDGMREKFSKPLELSADFSGAQLDLASLIQFDEESVDPETGETIPAKLVKGFKSAISQATEDAQRIAEKANFVQGLRLNGLDDLADQVEKVDGPALVAIMSEIGSFMGEGAKAMERELDAAADVVLKSTNPIQKAIDVARKNMLLEARRAQIVFALEASGKDAVAGIFAAIKPEDLEEAIRAFELAGDQGITAWEQQIDDFTAAGIDYIKTVDPLGQFSTALGETSGAQGGLLPEGWAQRAFGSSRPGDILSADAASDFGLPADSSMIKPGETRVDNDGNTWTYLPNGTWKLTTAAKFVGAKLGQFGASYDEFATLADEAARLSKKAVTFKGPGGEYIVDENAKMWRELVEGTREPADDFQRIILEMIKARDGVFANEPGSTPSTVQAAAAGAAETSAYASGLTADPTAIQTAAQQMVNLSVIAISDAVDAARPTIALKAGTFTNAVVEGINTELTYVKPIFDVIGFQIVEALMVGMVSPTAITTIDSGMADVAANLIVSFVDNVQVTTSFYAPTLGTYGASLARAVIGGVDSVATNEAAPAAAKFLLYFVDSIEITAETVYPTLGAIGGGMTTALGRGMTDPATLAANGGIPGTGLITMIWVSLFGSALAYQPNFVDIGASIIDNIRIGVDQSVPALLTRIDSFGDDLVSNLDLLRTRAEVQALKIGESIGDAIGDGLRSSVANIGLAGGPDGAAAGGVAAVTEAVTGKTTGPGVNIGEALIDGMIVGMQNKLPTLVAAVQAIATIIAMTMRLSLAVKSPSRVTMSIGEQVTEGLAIGIESGQDRVVNAAAALAQQVGDTITAKMTEPMVDPANWFGDPSGANVARPGTAAAFMPPSLVNPDGSGGWSQTTTPAFGAIPTQTVVVAPTQPAADNGLNVTIEHMDVRTDRPEDVADELFKQVEPAAWRVGAWGM